MQRASLALALGLATILPGSSALAHCGFCGVGGTSKAKTEDPHSHDHDHQSHAEMALSASSQGPEAPGYRLFDSEGEVIDSKDLEGKVVVLEWTNPNCPYVKRHSKEGTMRRLASKWAKKGVVWMAVNSTKTANLATNRQHIAQASLPYKVLADPSGEVGKAFGARTTPHVFVIDSSGHIAYEGAVDDDPHGKKRASQRVGYLDRALDAVTSGKSPSEASTRPYGCSVKYP